jgi:hypothetical protein
MTTKRLLLAAFVFPWSLVACGGAVDPGLSGSTPPSTPEPPPAPAPPAPQPLPAPQPVPPSPTPAEHWNTDASGCANFLVYRSHSTGKKFLVLQASKEELGIANYGDTATVSLGPGTHALVVSMDVYARQPSDTHYCSDIIIDPQTPITWTATKGTATVKITGVERDCDCYTVTIELRGVVVRSPSGQLEQIPDMVFKDVRVGWLPG